MSEINSFKYSNTPLSVRYATHPQCGFASVMLNAVGKWHFRPLVLSNISEAEKTGKTVLN